MIQKIFKRSPNPIPYFVVGVSNYLVLNSNTALNSVKPNFELL